MPTSSLPSRVLKMLTVYKDQGKNNWLSRSMNVYSIFESFTNISFDVFLSKPEATIKNLIKNKLQNLYESKWKENISDINAQPKLRTYSKFKTEIYFEPYLSLVVPKHHMIMSRFRCSADHLAIETGRHQKPKVPTDDGICLECKTLEDEMHHLIHCSKHDNIRKDLYETANSHIENFSNLNPSAKFKELLLCKNLKVQKALALLLIHSSK